MLASPWECDRRFDAAGDGRDSGNAVKINSRDLAYGLLSGGGVLALLVYGRPFLMPLAFALLLWAVLNALVDFLRRFRFPAWLAWPTAFALIGAGLYFVVLVLANETVAMAQQWPAYIAKLQHLWSVHVTYTHLLPALNAETLLRDANVQSMLARIAASIGTMLLNLVLVIIYVGFLLAEQRYLPDKLARFRNSAAETGSERVTRAIGRQIQSYLGVCTFLSVLMGAVCYAVLIFFGVDFAGLWALMMFLLTYIPTVGAAGVALPALMALAQFGAPGPALAIFLVLVVTHFILTNIVETILLGRSLDLSPFAIIISLTFWGMIWGVGGLFLAVPLTGAIAIASRHVEGMEWIGNLIARQRSTVRR